MADTKPHLKSQTSEETKESDLSKDTPSKSSPKEDSSLLDPTREIKSYKRRWYVLGVFAYAALLQAVVWNTFGPIAQSAKAVFGWTDANIALFYNGGNIGYMFFMIPVAWLMDVKGLRTSMLACAVLMVVATSIRCITTKPEPATWLINIAAVVNGVAGTVPFAGPALLSATWFPPKQRATATAVSTVFFYLGMSIGFIIGPLLVPEPGGSFLSVDQMIPLNTSLQNDEAAYIHPSATDITAERDGIMKLMYVECAACVLLLLLVVVYFPAKPPSPPSLTASMERTNYLQGLKGLCTHRRFLLILVAYSVPAGVYNVFVAVLDVNLNGLGITQNHAGWIGFYATIGGCFAALIMSRIADLLVYHMKCLLLILFLLAAASTVWFVLLRLSYLPFTMLYIYTSSILVGVFINGSIPLFYELGCEASYPIAEGVTAGMLTLMYNLAGIIFLSALMIPNIGVIWMNWCLLGTVIFAIPLLLVFRAHYPRTNIDTKDIREPLPNSNEPKTGSTEAR
ncbi:solute carrier family 49 member 4 homolog [Haliotis rufescens]|uniref:solute carrier family 49 member 4 homolog n=1 Tax=Haliotis rufescens TaxID=6454 RepID=UPI00201F1494|nr:solute carrier family 49 member 4 homolog [Haliotis rufescens]